MNTKFNENEEEFGLPNWFKNLFKLKLKADPDFHLDQDGKPYLTRWWLIPRNRLFNIWLHKISQSDLDGALHDHPWSNLTFVLKGGYEEKMLKYPKNLLNAYEDFTSFEGKDETIAKRKQFGFVARRARAPHRLIVKEPAWTLFFTGPFVREWGFHCKEGWVHWKEYKARRVAALEKEQKETTTVPNTVNKDKLDFEF